MNTLQKIFCFTSTNFSEITIEVAKSFQQMATDQEKSLKYQVKPNVSILSEYKYLYELVNILIDNAVKYCDDKGLVEVKLSQSKKTVTLSVTNDYIDGKNIDYSRFLKDFTVKILLIAVKKQVMVSDFPLQKNL